MISVARLILYDFESFGSITALQSGSITEFVVLLEYQRGEKKREGKTETSIGFVSSIQLNVLNNSINYLVGCREFTEEECCYVGY